MHMHRAVNSIPALAANTFAVAFSNKPWKTLELNLPQSLKSAAAIFKCLTLR